MVNTYSKLAELLRERIIIVISVKGGQGVGAFGNLFQEVQVIFSLKKECN